jgi:hypothetical protein
MTSATSLTLDQTDPSSPPRAAHLSSPSQQNPPAFPLLFLSLTNWARLSSSLLVFLLPSVVQARHARRACAAMGRAHRPHPRWRALPRLLLRLQPNPRLAFAPAPADGCHVAPPSRSAHPGRPLAGAAPRNPSPRGINPHTRCSFSVL